MRKRTNYLNNRDLMTEINKSKMSYCELTDEKYWQYDIIVSSMDEVNDKETLAEARKNRAARLSGLAYLDYVENLVGKKTKKMADFAVEPSEIDEEDVVIRYLTFDHIPESDRKRNPRTEAEKYVKLNFTPYKHFAQVDGVITEVGRSHSKDGEFALETGEITPKLANMMMLLVKRYSQRSNWRGYTYVEEMVGQALLQLCQMCLQFDEHKSDNPFSYYTASISNSFKRVLNSEKQSQNLRDDLLQEAGHTPSFTRQMNDEQYVRENSGFYDDC